MFLFIPTLVILFENQIQTTSTSPCRTQVQPAASFLVCSLIFIEYKKTNFETVLLYPIFTNLNSKMRTFLAILSLIFIGGF